MTLILSPEAVSDLEEQLAFLIDKGAIAAAERLEQRVSAFLEDVVCRHPGIDVPVEHRDLLETWIPEIKLVVWYRTRGTSIEIVRFWHGARDRSA